MGVKKRTAHSGSFYLASARKMCYTVPNMNPPGMHAARQQLLRLKDLVARLLPRTKGHTITMVIFGSFVLVGLVATTVPAFAQLIDFDTIINGIIYAAAWIMFGIASLFIKITIFLLQFFILIAGYNNYINADVVKLGWNMIRDVTNMFFVVALLVIAFGTILGIESYEWRKTLPKLIIAALLVNFSNLICQLIIDVAQVFTITFLNAVAGAAGGNLIQMFNFEDIYRISTAEAGTPEQGITGNGIRLEWFIASVIALTFTAIAMITMFAYTVVMLMRMVVLWSLIILSPLAFVLGALPSTKAYADEFWKEFTNHVLVAPVMVFFLWLAFATFGGGTVVQDHLEKDHPIKTANVTNRVDTDGKSVSAGLSKASTYDNMANFAVALAFLMMGLERVQKLGVRGGGLVQSAANFGKKVATIASGVALARWAGAKTRDATFEAGKDYAQLAFGGLRYLPGVSRIPIIGARGKIERKARLAKQEEYLGAKKKEWEAGIQAQRGGVLTPSHEAMARQRFATENAEREAKAEKETVEGQFRINVIKGQGKEYKKELEGELAKAREAKLNNAIAAKKKELGVSELTDAQRQQVEEETGGLTRKEIAAIRTKVGNKYSEMRLAQLEGKAGAKQSKAKKERELMQAEGKDTDRLRENKGAKYIRAIEDADHADDIKEYARMSFDDRKRELQQQMKLIRDSRPEYEALVKAGQGDSARARDLKESLKNGQREVMLILTSSHEQGEGNDMMEYGVMGAMSKQEREQWENMGGWNTEENYGRVIQSAVTGRKVQEFMKQEAVVDSDGNPVINDDGSPLTVPTEWDAEKAAKFENDARKIVSDKWNLTMRGLMRSLNESSGKTNSPHQSNQVRVGYTAGEQEELGFAENLVQGEVGRRGRIASGDKTADGAAIRKGKQDYARGELEDLNDIKDARSIFQVNQSGQAMDFSEESLQKLRALVGMSAGEIRRLHRSVLNMASGGAYDKSSYNRETGQFDPASPKVKAMFQGIISQMQAGINEEGISETTQDRRIEALQELMRKLTGEVVKVSRDGAQMTTQSGRQITV